MFEAIKLMLTGMSTVFVILILIVVLGNLIVIVTNKFAREQVSIPAKNQTAKQKISSGKLAAIVATVDVVTDGKGKVTSISKSKE